MLISREKFDRINNDFQNELCRFETFALFEKFSRDFTRLVDSSFVKLHNAALYEPHQVKDLEEEIFLNLHKHKDDILLYISKTLKIKRK